MCPSYLRIHCRWKKRCVVSLHGCPFLSLSRPWRCLPATASIGQWRTAGGAASPSSSWRSKAGPWFSTGPVLWPLGLLRIGCSWPMGMSCGSLATTMRSFWVELIVVRDGQVVREFREAAEAPEENSNRGRLEIEADEPIRDWTDVAAFVDEDELGFEPDRGLLLQFRRPDEESPHP